METPPLDPDPDAPPLTEEWERPLGTVRAHAAPRELPPRGPVRTSSRWGPVLVVLAVVVVLGAGGFVAWRLASRDSSAGGGGLGTQATTGAKASARSGSAKARRGSGPRASKRGSAGASRSTPSRSASKRSGSAPERSAVVAVSDVLAFAGRGRTAAQHGDWTTALSNRQATLARVGRIRAGASLTGPIGFLKAALAASIRADQARVKCGCGAENPQDVAATELKRRFLAGFNPLATRYLKRTYSEPDI